MELLESLRKDLLRMLNMLSILQRQRLYDVAYSFIGADASPDDVAPDELGCADSLSQVIDAAFPELRFPTIVSTRELLDYLTRSPSFQEIDSPQKGDIIMSATGTGKPGFIGHCGIVGKAWIMSNDSRTGTWEANYTLDGWKRYYEGRGGIPTKYFRVV